MAGADRHIDGRRVGVWQQAWRHPRPDPPLFAHHQLGHLIRQLGAQVPRSPVVQPLGRLTTSSSTRIGRRHRLMDCGRWPQLLDGPSGGFFWGGMPAVSSKVSGTPSSTSSLSTRSTGGAGLVGDDSPAARRLRALSRPGFCRHWPANDRHLNPSATAGLGRPPPPASSTALRTSSRAATNRQHHRGPAGLPRNPPGPSSSAIGSRSLLAQGFRCGAVIPLSQSAIASWAPGGCGP